MLYFKPRFDVKDIVVAQRNRAYAKAGKEAPVLRVRELDTLVSELEATWTAIWGMPVIEAPTRLRKLKLKLEEGVYEDFPPKNPKKLKVKRVTKKLPLLGSGHFSQVYLKGIGRVHIRSRCLVKFAFSDESFPKSGLFPELKLIKRGDTSRFYSVNEFETNYLRVVDTYAALKTLLNPRQLAVYEDLYNLGCNMGSADVQGYLKCIKNAYARKEITRIYKTLNNMNIGRVGMDVKPENVGVTLDGKLSLFDIFFA